MTSLQDRKSTSLFYGWWVVFAAVVGLALSPIPLALMTIGVFMNPLGAEFGWDRAQISAAYFVGNLMTAVATPYAGSLVDRFGARSVLLPSMLLLAANIASLYFLSGSLLHLYVMFFLVGTLAAGASGVVFSRVVTAWFDRKRGLALGLTMSGIGVGAAIAPFTTQLIIESYGWREAYLALGMVIVIVGFPIIYFLLRESPESMGLSVDGTNQVGADGERRKPRNYGPNLKQALRTTTFWLIGVSFFTASLGLNGIIAHLVPLMTDRNFDPAVAAFTASLMGSLIMASRAGIGFLLDHFFAPYVAIVFFIVGAAGLFLLAVSGESFLVYVGAILIGIGLGAQTNIMSFLIGRYFGVKAYGVIYGLIYSAFIVGAGISPLILGVAYETLGSYRTILFIDAGIILLAGVFVSRLGSFPSWQQKEADL